MMQISVRRGSAGEASSMHAPGALCRRPRVERGRASWRRRSEDSAQRLGGAESAPL